MEFQYCKIDLEKSTREEIEEEIHRLKKLSDENNNTQMALKLFLNSNYGALANPFFACFNVDLAEAITLQGQDFNFKYTVPAAEEYFNKDFWYDTEIHKELGVEVKEIPVSNSPITIYGDTDSCNSLSYIELQENVKMTISDLYKNYEKINGFNYDNKGNEIVDVDNLKILNWSVKKKLYYGKVKKLIRHKVTKDKWTLKTKLGKEITVTGDHSLVVFRDNQQLTVKACEVLPTDKVLINLNE